MPKTIRIQVKALPAKGFNRAGRHWTRETTEAEVTEEQLAQLQAESMLAVLVIDAAGATKAAK
jgi:hypothetical protein